MRYGINSAPGPSPAAGRYRKRLPEPGGCSIRKFTLAILLAVTICVPAAYAFDSRATDKPAYLASARTKLAKLKRLCLLVCEEEDDLDAAIKQATKGH